MTYLYIAIILAWLVLSGALFFFQMNNQARSDFQNVLQDVTESNANTVEFAFVKYINLLKVSAEFLRNAENDEEYFTKVINDIANLEDFVDIAIVLPDNTSYVTDGKNLAKGTYSFTTQMANSEIYVTDVYYDQYVGGDAVAVNVPLISDAGELLAYISGILSTKDLSRYFCEKFYVVDGYFNLVDSKGKYIAASESEDMLAMDISFYDAMFEVEFLDTTIASDLLRSMRSKNSSSAEYSLADQVRTAYFTPVNVNDWILVSVVPKDIIDEKIYAHLYPTILLIINIILLFSAMVYRVYKTQTALAKTAEANERNFRFVSEQTQKYILEWDFSHNKLKITGDLKKFLPTELDVLFVDINKLHRYINRKDIFIARSAIDKLRHGERVTDLKIRVFRQNDTYLWCSFSAVPIDSKNGGNAYDRALGFMENIDDQQKESAKLKKMSELDSLTQIYNKGTTEALIAQVVSESKVELNTHSLLIIDLDNFKQLNDTFGHQYGDEVIKDLARYLKNLFRHSDIVGRIGGDEFFVFMRNTYSLELVTDKCRRIVDKFNKSYEEHGKIVRISASIGVAMYPQHGSSFTKLYRHADIALYTAKQEGKNSYRFFDGRDDIDYVSQRTSIDSSKNSAKAELMPSEKNS